MAAKTGELAFPCFVYAEEMFLGVEVELYDL